MIETLVFTLLMKKLQIVFLMVAITVASVLSIYNLPWREVEWNALENGIRKFRLSNLFAFRLIKLDWWKKGKIESEASISKMEIC